MENNKSPGNDGLSKEFYECLWNEIRNPEILRQNVKLRVLVF